MNELAALMALGRRMEAEPELVLKVAAEWLLVRDRTGRLQPLEANAAQQAFEAKRGRQNIVLKARQMGITTWVAGRFFLRTATTPGTLSLLVAHTQAAAEGIFAGVERMWQGLPEDLRKGPLRRGRANAGQMTFPILQSEFRVSSAADPSAGRGLSVQNLHCSEVSRWPRDARGTLAGLRAALAPGGELVLESTPNGAYGCFYEEWCAGVEVSDMDPTHDDETVVNGVPVVPVGLSGSSEYRGLSPLRRFGPPVEMTGLLVPVERAGSMMAGWYGTFCPGGWSRRMWGRLFRVNA